MMAVSTPDGTTLAAFLGCVAFFLMILHYGGGIIDRFRGQPPNEQLKASAAELERRIADLEQNKKDASEGRRVIYEKIEKFRESVESKMDGVRREFEDKIDGVRDQVKTVLSAVSELRGEIRGRHEDE